MTRIPPVRSRRLAAAAFLVADSARSRALGADPQSSSPPASTPVHVAAVDITQSFRRYPGVLQAMEELKHWRAILAGQVAAARRELREARERLAILTPGSEAHRLVEAKIARRRTQVRERIDRAKGKFREQESRIYDATYDALVNTVVQYAKHHDMALSRRSEPWPMTSQPI